MDKQRFLLLFFRVQPEKIPWRPKIVVFRPEHPKWDQTLWFAPLSETTSIPDHFTRESPSPRAKMTTVKVFGPGPFRVLGGKSIWQELALLVNWCLLRVTTNSPAPCWQNEGLLSFWGSFQIFSRSPRLCCKAVHTPIPGQWCSNKQIVLICAKIKDYRTLLKC